MNSLDDDDHPPATCNTQHNTKLQTNSNTAAEEININFQQTRDRSALQIASSKAGLNLRLTLHNELQRSNHHLSLPDQQCSTYSVTEQELGEKFRLNSRAASTGSRNSAAKNRKFCKVKQNQIPASEDKLMANQTIVIKTGQSKLCNQPKQRNHSHQLNMSTPSKLKRKGGSARYFFFALLTSAHKIEKSWVKHPQTTPGLPARPFGCKSQNVHPDTTNQILTMFPTLGPWSFRPNCWIQLSSPTHGLSAGNLDHTNYPLDYSDLPSTNLLDAHRNP
jgi:hypothetical protein